MHLWKLNLIHSHKNNIFHSDKVNCKASSTWDCKLENLIEHNLSKINTGKKKQATSCVQTEQCNDKTKKNLQTWHLALLNTAQHHSPACSFFIFTYMFSLIYNLIMLCSSSRTDRWVHFQQNAGLRLFVHTWIVHGIDDCYQLTRTFGGFSAQCLSKLFLKEFTVLLLTTSLGRGFQVVVILIG